MNPPSDSDPTVADEIVKVSPSQGKGLGLFTTRSVAPGQLLVKEKPLVKVRMAPIFIMTFPMLLLSKQPSLNCLMARPRWRCPTPPRPWRSCWASWGRECGGCRRRTRTPSSLSTTRGHSSAPRIEVDLGSCLHCILSDSIWNNCKWINNCRRHYADGNLPVQLCCAEGVW